MDSSSAGKLPPSSPLSAAKGAAALAVGPTMVAAGQAVGAANGAARVRPDSRELDRRERDRRRASAPEAGASGSGPDGAASAGHPAPSDLPPIDHAGWLTLAALPRSDDATSPASGADVRRAYQHDDDEPGGPSVSRTA